MIGNLERQGLTARAFHCATIPDPKQFLRATLGLDDQGAEEMLEQVKPTAVESPADIFYKPFDSRRTASFPQSRFSDGTWAVRYTALELVTAIIEVQSGRLKRVRADEVTDATLNLHHIECNFEGAVKDLRPCLRWPSLTSDNGYDDCNRVARAALNEQLDGLLAPSARRVDGTCLPIFRREAASQPRLIGSARYKYDSAQARWVESER